MAVSLQLITVWNKCDISDITMAKLEVHGYNITKSITQDEKVRSDVSEEWPLPNLHTPPVSSSQIRDIGITQLTAQGYENYSACMPGAFR